MNKWLKRSLYGAGGLLLLMLIGYFSLNWIAGYAVESSAGSATGVEANVGGIDVSPFRGTFAMNRLTLDNPESQPFDSDRFMLLERTDAFFSLTSFLQSKVEIPEVRLQGLDINIERKNGVENYQLILDHLGKVSSGEQEGGQQYIISNLIVEDITVTFAGYPGMNRELHLGNIHMTDVGSGEGGVSRRQVIGILIREVFRQMLRNPEMLPGMFHEGVLEGMKKLGGLGKVGVTFLGNITDGAGNVIMELGGAVGSVGRALGDILGGNDGTEGEKNE